MPNGEKKGNVKGEGQSATVQRHQVGYSQKLLTTDLFSVDWEPNGTYALIVGRKGLVAKYDAKTGVLKERTDVGTNQTLNSIEFQKPNGPALIVGGNWPDPKTCVGTVIEYDPITDTFRALLEIPSNKTQREYEKFWDVAWKPKTNEGLVVGERTGLAYTFWYTTQTIETKTTRKYVFYEFRLSRPDISEIDWKPPNGDYALIAGDAPSLLKFDGISMTNVPYDSDPMATSVSWKPDGEYALVGNGSGQVWKYNPAENKLEKLPDTGLKVDILGLRTLNKIAWKSNGDCALIVGEEGALLKYDPQTNKFTEIKGVIKGINLEGVAWRPANDYALIVGGFKTPYLAKCDGDKILETILPPSKGKKF